MQKDVSMLFCEKCNRLSNDSICAICGKKKLREVREDDFCYFLTLPAFKTNIFEANLKDENIPVATFGQGYDFATKRSTEYNFFIPYKFIDRAKDLYKLLFE